MKHVEITDIFESDIGVYYVESILYKNEKPLTRVIEGCNVHYVNEKLSHYHNSLKEFFEDYIYSNFDSYLKLPCIDYCSDLLQDIFYTVNTSESCMCCISEDEWNGYFQEYSEKDIKTLEKEIKKYNLKDVITLNKDGYKIIAYGDLQTKFTVELSELEIGMSL